MKNFKFVVFVFLLSVSLFGQVHPDYEWYVSNFNGSDENTGAVDSPLASIQRAVDLIREYYNDRQNWYPFGTFYNGFQHSATIIIKGEIKLDHNVSDVRGMIEIDGERLPPIIIKGVEGYDNIINANGIHRVFYIYNGANVTIANNITITGGGRVNSGGGVYIIDSTLILDGGNIIENAAYGAGRGDGAGVLVGSNAKFFMKSGNISYNEAYNGNSVCWGGGVHVDSGGLFVMIGGEISFNSIRFDYGGGVGVFRGGTFMMIGGIIRENVADMGANNVFTDSNSTFIMTGGIIAENVENTIINGYRIIPETNVLINGIYINQSGIIEGIIAKGYENILNLNFHIENLAE